MSEYPHVQSECGSCARVPAWLKMKTGKASQARATRKLLHELGVHTVCEQAMCPNIGECYSSHTATFMILGYICTRDCGFCAVRHGRPAPPDPSEPERIAEAAVRLGLRFVVLTCVTRDDLPDGGAAHFVRTMQALRVRLPGVGIEVLTSDFGGQTAPLQQVLAAQPTVFNHNVETVERLQPVVRPQASYQRSLAVLRWAAQHEPAPIVKSGFMVGLGESRDEVDATLADLAQAGCSIVTIGQYLRPTQRNLPVARYLEPAEFEQYAAIGRAHGLRRVVSGPFVRSSYCAASAAAALTDAGNNPATLP